MYVALEFLETSAYEVYAFEVSAKLMNNSPMRCERSTATLHISGIKVFHVKLFDVVLSVLGEIALLSKRRRTAVDLHLKHISQIPEAASARVTGGGRYLILYENFPIPHSVCWYVEMLPSFVVLTFMVIATGPERKQPDSRVLAWRIQRNERWQSQQFRFFFIFIGYTYIVPNKFMALTIWQIPGRSDCARSRKSTTILTIYNESFRIVEMVRSPLGLRGFFCSVLVACKVTISVSLSFWYALCVCVYVGIESGHI